MIFTVVWLPTALNKLATLWINAPAPQAVTTASNAIDKALRTDADNKGRPFFGRRILAIPPLAVTFDVSLDDRLVSVADIWLIP